MGRKLHEWADVPAGHDSPLNYAVTTRDLSLIDMVDKAVRAGRAILAYQPVVTSGDTSRPAFYEGLIRVMDKNRRVITASDFIGAIESTETGRLID